MSGANATFIFALTGATACFPFLRRWYSTRGVLPSILAATALSEVIWVVVPFLFEWAYVKDFGRRLPDPRVDPDYDLTLFFLVLLVFWVGLVAGAAASAVAFAYHFVKK